MSLVAASAVACGSSEVGEADKSPSASTSALATLEYQHAIANEAGYIKSGPNPVGFLANGDEIGEAWWKQGSDAWLITDDLLDSQGVGVYWELGDGSRRGLCHLTFGATTYGVCEKNLPEGMRVSARIGRCDGSTADCTKWSNYTNLGEWYTFTND